MSPQSAAPSFTPKQGQYLAFIYAYTRVLGRPPAEADLQRHFGVSPPSVHQMVLTLERARVIRRQSRFARSIEVLITSELFRVLYWSTCPVRRRVRCPRLTHPGPDSLQKSILRSSSAQAGRHMLVFLNGGL